MAHPQLDAQSFQRSTELMAPSQPVNQHMALCHASTSAQHQHVKSTQPSTFCKLRMGHGQHLACSLAGGHLSTAGYISRVWRSPHRPHNCPHYAAGSPCTVGSFHEPQALLSTLRTHNTTSKSWSTSVPCSRQSRWLLGAHHSIC